MDCFQFFSLTLPLGVHFEIVYRPTGYQLVYVIVPTVLSDNNNWCGIDNITNKFSPINYLIKQIPVNAHFCL